jgi:hypothetical protein
MPRTSESVAALACALAKAQAELVNPEKSLTATIKGVRAGEGDRTFRYAPLSSGLDIVRKTLGQHEIASIQTTAIDQAAGLVNLTTTLAHASGEWIASDWPVCPIADMATPRRMGAALTYARRYALFTLVGIAGEDDLDAPDLQEVDERSSGATNGAGNAGIARQGRGPLPRSSSNGHARGAVKGDVVDLAPDQSAVLRDRLLGEVASITELDKAATWARGALATKNSLRAADAKRVEDAFEQRMSGLSLSETEGLPISSGQSSPAPVQGPVATTEHAPTAFVANRQPQSIDKSVLTVSTPRRYRSKVHLRYVAQQPCLVCGRKPSDPHHLRYMQPRALGRKASDEFSVPLCRIHHRLVHRVGNETAWWKEAGIDPIAVARELWGRTLHAQSQQRTVAPLELPQSASDQNRLSQSDGTQSPPA